MSSMPSRTALTILLLATLVACAPPAPVMRPDPVPVDLAQAAFDAGQYRDAAEAWEARAEADPEQSPALLAQAAEAWLRAGETDRAAALSQALTVTALAPADRQRLDLVEAELALDAGELTRAGRLLTRDREDLDPALKAWFDQLSSELDRRLADPAAEAYRALARAVREPDFEPELALARLVGLPTRSLVALYEQHGDDPATAPWLDLMAASRIHLLDDERLAQSIVDWSLRHPGVGYSAVEALEWLILWRQTVARPQRVSILLPGTQALARPAQALRDGLLSAWLALPTDRRPVLHFDYLLEDADAAISAWFTAREQGSELMIGPIDRPQVDALLTLPEAGLPMLLLNLPTEREALFRAPGQIAAIGLLPEDEAELAAIHALVSGHRRAVVMIQNTGWGRRVADAFIEAFRLGGGEIVGQAEYPAQEVDHSPRITTLLDLDRSEQRIARLTRLIGELESEPRRRTDLDLVFLAGRAADARQIKPQLRFFDADDVPVYATSHVVLTNEDRRRDRDLDGVIVPVAPWLLPDSSAATQRAAAEAGFSGLDNFTLSMLHALGRDALAMSAWLELMLADPALYYPGLSGRLRIADGRVIERDLPFARFVNGRLVEF